MERIDRVVVIDMWILGERRYPFAHVKLPEDVVRDFPRLLELARGLNPAVSAESVARAIWRLGSYRLEQNLLRRIPLATGDVSAQK
jgi:hypothetical protein